MLFWIFIAFIGLLLVWLLFVRPHRVERRRTLNFGVVVSGGTRGVGRALVESFVGHGDRVVFCGRDAATVRDVEREINDAAEGKGCAIGVCCDVSAGSAAIELFLARAADALGGHVDLMVHNVGVSASKLAPLADTDDDELAAIVNVNVLATLRVCRVFARTFEGTGAALVLVDGAGANQMATPDYAVYGFSKAGYPQLMSSLAKEWRHKDVSIHLASPGMVATRLLLRDGMQQRPRATRRIINALTVRASTSAAFLVPRLRTLVGRRRSGAYIRFLTGFGVLCRFATMFCCRERFIDEDTGDVLIVD